MSALLVLIISALIAIFLLMRLFIIVPGVRVKACGFPNTMNPKEWIQQRKCHERKEKEQGECIFGVMDVFDNSDIGGSSPIYFVYTKSHSIYPTLVSITTLLLHGM